MGGLPYRIEDCQEIFPVSVQNSKIKEAARERQHSPWITLRVTSTSAQDKSGVNIGRSFQTGIELKISDIYSAIRSNSPVGLRPIDESRNCTRQYAVKRCQPRVCFPLRALCSKHFPGRCSLARWFPGYEFVAFLIDINTSSPAIFAGTLNSEIWISPIWAKIAKI